MRGKHHGSVAVIPSNELSFCCHCHPADGTFDPLVHTISLIVLA